MSVYEGRGQLSRAMKDLTARWQETKYHWDDPVSRAFEREFLEPLEAELRDASSAMDHMSVLLQQIRGDCGDSENG
jgi:hypothetical protein